MKNSRCKDTILPTVSFPTALNGIAVVRVTKVKTIIRVSSGRNGEMGAPVYLILCH